MPLNLPTFYKRTGSAIVFAIIMLGGLLWNDWAFLGLVCIICSLCLWEYCKLMQRIDKEAYWPKWLPIVLIVAGLIILIPAFFLNHLFDSSYPDWPVRLWGVLPVLPAILLLAGALAKRTYLVAVIQSFGGILYIALSLLLLLNMRMQDMILPIALILMIWTNDTMAYLVGSFIGKTPFSTISPKKTWEGTIGGALLTIIGAVVYGYFSHRYTLIDWVVLALCATIAGTMGDLLESKLKRMADVKDSGAIMPGHGGALDRFDSLLVAAPFAYVYANYFMK
ncbi:MAG: phosphatidate cytidylyltransferase [Bacteroidota bacterium]